MVDNSNPVKHGGQAKMLTLPVGPRALASARLRRAIAARGLSQEAAARLVAKDGRQVRRWLSGRVALGALELLVELERLDERKAA